MFLNINDKQQSFNLFDSFNKRLLRLCPELALPNPTWELSHEQDTSLQRACQRCTQLGGEIGES